MVNEELGGPPLPSPLPTEELWATEQSPEPVPRPWRSPQSAPIMVNGPRGLSGPAAFLIHRSPQIPPAVPRPFLHRVLNFQIVDKISINST